MSLPLTFTSDELSPNRGERARTHEATLANESRPDGALARLARAGDRDAFAELVERYLPRIRAFLFRLSRDHQDPDDWTQETFVIAISRLTQLREPDRVAGWLFGIAYRVFHASRRARTVGSMGAEALDAVAALDSKAAIDVEDGRAIWSALDTLPDSLREAFLLRHVEELSPAETAAILGVPAGTARRWDFEARERLRGILTRGVAARGGP